MDNEKDLDELSSEEIEEMFKEIIESDKWGFIDDDRKIAVSCDEWGKYCRLDPPS